MTKLAIINKVITELVNFKIKPEDLAESLLALPVETRAMVISKAYSDFLEGTDVKVLAQAQERVSRRIEGALDEIPKEDHVKTVLEMIKAGDVNLILNMVRSYAGEYSSTANFLNVELIKYLFETDANLNRAGGVNSDRLVYICWTLVVESSDYCKRQISLFFYDKRYKYYSNKYWNKLKDLSGDEEAQQILRELSQFSFTENVDYFDEKTMEDYFQIDD